MKHETPSMDLWMKEAKARDSSKQCGMYLFHNGIVRQTAKAMAREGATDTTDVKAMLFSYDQEKVDQAVKRVLKMPGIFYAKAWLNEGELEVGDDIMLVLIGGDIRPRVIDALQSLVGELKNKCVMEKEIF